MVFCHDEKYRNILVISNGLPIERLRFAGTTICHATSRGTGNIGRTEQFDSGSTTIWRFEAINLWYSQICQSPST